MYCLACIGPREIHMLLGTFFVQSLSCIPLFVTPWTVAHQARLSMGFSRQYWSGLPFPSPEDLLRLGIKPISSVLAGRFFTTEPSGKVGTLLTS